MKYIAVTGTKGGVGKSTYASILSIRLSRQGKKVILLDLDVECPNDYLLFGRGKGKNIAETFSQFPKIIKSKCKKCGICAKVCKNNAIFWVENQYPKIIPELCSGCGACWIVCPYNAIKVLKKSNGKVYLQNVNKNLWIMTGVSKAGMEETGDVVSQVRKIAENFAKLKKVDYIIIDTAAGMHCNVLKSLIGVEKAYVVTEPTPLGAHDLKLSLQLLKKMQIKAAVVINKSNIGRKSEIIKISKRYSVKIVEEIPYSKEILNAYMEGNFTKLKEKY